MKLTRMARLSRIGAVFERWEMEMAARDSPRNHRETAPLSRKYIAKTARAPTRRRPALSHAQVPYAKLALAKYALSVSR